MIHDENDGEIHMSRFGLYHACQHEDKKLVVNQLEKLNFQVNNYGTKSAEANLSTKVTVKELKMKNGNSGEYEFSGGKLGISAVRRDGEICLSVNEKNVDIRASDIVGLEKRGPIDAKDFDADDFCIAVEYEREKETVKLIFGRPDEMDVSKWSNLFSNLQRLIK
jgi:hypothetical protein